MDKNTPWRDLPTKYKFSNPEYWKLADVLEEIEQAAKEREAQEAEAENPLSTGVSETNQAPVSENGVSSVPAHGNNTYEEDDLPYYQDDDDYYNAGAENAYIDEDFDPSDAPEMICDMTPSDGRSVYDGYEDEPYDEEDNSFWDWTPPYEGWDRDHERRYYGGSFEDDTSEEADENTAAEESVESVSNTESTESVSDTQAAPEISEAPAEATVTVAPLTEKAHAENPVTVPARKSKSDKMIDFDASDEPAEYDAHGNRRFINIVTAALEKRALEEEKKKKEEEEKRNSLKSSKKKNKKAEKKKAEEKAKPKEQSVSAPVPAKEDTICHFIDREHSESIQRYEREAAANGGSCVGNPHMIVNYREFIANAVKDRSKIYTPYNYEMTADEKAFMREIFFNKIRKDDHVILWDQKLFIPVKARSMYGEKFRNNFLKRFREQDMYFTPNVFTLDKNSEGNYIASNKVVNLRQVISVPLDVDYRGHGNMNGKYDNVSPEDFYKIIQKECGKDLPEPNYIEVGNCLRLIYNLSEPVVIANGPGVLNLVKAEQKYFAKLIADRTGVKVEAQGLHTYYRMPGSINSKTGDRVHYHRISKKRFTAQELSQYLPVLERDKEEYDDYLKDLKKEREDKNTKARNIGPHTTFVMNQERLQDYNKLVKYIPEGHRQMATFLAGIAYMQTHYKTASYEDLKLFLVNFNESMPRPRPEKEVIAACKNVFESYNKYRFRNETILEWLGLPLSLLRKLKCHIDVKSEEELAEERAQHQEEVRKNREDRKHSTVLKRADILERLTPVYLEKAYSHEALRAMFGLSDSMLRYLITMINGVLFRQDRDLPEEIIEAILFGKALRDELDETGEITKEEQFIEDLRASIEEELKKAAEENKEKANNSEDSNDEENIAENLQLEVNEKLLARIREINEEIAIRKKKRMQQHRARRKGKPLRDVRRKSVNPGGDPEFAWLIA